MIEEVSLLNDFFNEQKLNVKCIRKEERNYGSIFKLKLSPSAKIKKVSAALEELQLLLRGSTLPKLNLNIEEGLVDLEVINKIPQSASVLDEFLKYAGEDDVRSDVCVVIGKDFEGNAIKFNLSQNPHMLIAGSTGSGKSSLLHNILANLLLRDYQTFIVDSKGEFEPYSTLKKCNYISNYSEYYSLLKYLNKVMEDRYSFAKEHSIPNTQTYFSPLIFVIDEFADLMIQDKDKKCYELLCKLVQKCRAASIYGILATQRPSAKIIDGNIKANFPAKIACRTSSKTDSRIILDANGAEDLTGQGDVIIDNYKYSMQRFRANYDEPAAIIDILKWLDTI